jgi:hypothetical protein
VQVELAGHVGTVTINRPKVRASTDTNMAHCCHVHDARTRLATPGGTKPRARRRL